MIPAVDGKQAVHQLFTVDAKGWPHPALSSARQWWIGDERIACVIGLVAVRFAQSVLRCDDLFTGGLTNNRAKPKQRVGEPFSQRPVFRRLCPSFHRRLLHKYTGTS